MSDSDNKGLIDLGSAPVEDFDPFADEDELVDNNAANGATQPAAEIKTQTAAKEKSMRKPASKNKSNADDIADAAESTGPLAAALDAAEAKDAEKAKQTIYEKLPVFEYAGATEDIEDPSQTFDELRISKSADFPELEDGKRVNWTVEYGKITKNVTDAKGTSIGKMKSDIETSKEFLDALKKAKDKNPGCKVKPRVTAQAKGTVAKSGYKGVFTNMADVEAAGKVISILPAMDGKVYEVRNTPIGRFITPIAGSNMLSDVRAGFTPALNIPRIPMGMMMSIIAFFRYFTRHGADNEVMVNIYWDSCNKEFLVDTPAQIVSKISVHSSGSPGYQNERYIHFMDIHSHNSMQAFFSLTDDADEKATRLYTVIGRLDKYFPEIKTRISNGGKFHEIDPSEVFENIFKSFPEGWKDKVSFRSPHKDYGKENKGCEADGCCHGSDDNPWHVYLGKRCGCQ